METLQSIVDPSLANPVKRGSYKYPLTTNVAFSLSVRVSYVILIVWIVEYCILPPRPAIPPDIPPNDPILEPPPPPPPISTIHTTYTTCHNVELTSSQYELYDST